MNPSYMVPVVGCYRVIMCNKIPAAVAVQRNLPDFSPHAIPPFSAVLVARICGVLKGGADRSVFVAGIEDRTVRVKIMGKEKDATLGIQQMQAERAMRQIESDTTFLAKHGSCGYSLLVVVTETPYESFSAQNSNLLACPQPPEAALLGLHKLSLREAWGGDGREYIALEEYGTTGTLKEMSTIVAYPDVEAVKKAIRETDFPRVVAERAKKMKSGTATEEPGTQTVVNFPLVATAVSLDGYAMNRSFSAAAGSLKTAEEEGRRPSAMAALPDFNQVLKQTPTEGVDPETEDNCRRRSSYASRRGSALDDTAMGAEELKDIVQVLS